MRERGDLQSGVGRGRLPAIDNNLVRLLRFIVAQHFGQSHQHPRLLNVRAIFGEHNVIGQIHAHMKRQIVRAEQQQQVAETARANVPPDPFRETI